MGGWCVVGVAKEMAVFSSAPMEAYVKDVVMGAAADNVYTLCWKFDEEPFTFLPKFTVTVSDVASVAPLVAVAGVPTTFTFEGQSLKAGDFVRYVKGDSCEANYVTFDGASDIEAQTIRAVGDARKRFEEDPLRILRAARFEAQTGFEIEPATRDAAFSCAHLLDSVARERTGSELTKLLCGPYAGRVIENEFPIVVQAINELEVARSFKLKSKRHAYDLLGHLAHSVSAAPENEALRWAALLHDIAKPESNHDHAQRSSIAATRIMQRLRIGRQQTQQAADAIAWHTTSFPPSEEALRLFVACLGGDVPRARRALLLQRADASGHGPKGDAREKEVDEELAMLDTLECSGKPLGAKQLALSGKEVADLGNLHGSEIGRTLDALLAAVVEGKVENTPEALRSHLNFAIENAEEQIFQKKLRKFLTKR